MAKQPALEHVEQAWLDAGRRGDVLSMQRLRKEHPQWLALNRVIAFESNSTIRDDSEDVTSFCDWDKFHLPTVGASALHAAAWDGSDQVLKYLLEEGQPVDDRGRHGVTALMVTLLRHNVQALRAIFQGTAVVQLNTVVDCREEDALRLEHTLNVVNLLLRFGAETEARDQDGKTALLLATNDELYEVAKLLIDHGAHMDAQDSTGKSPLHLCLRTCPEQSMLVTNLLVSRGALIDLADKSGETPLTLIVQRGDTTALQLLLNHHSLVATLTRQDFSAAVLLQAADLGIVNIVCFLLEGMYTSIDVVNARGETSLHVALVKQRKALVETLCTFKSATLLLQARTKGTCESVLHYAARYGSARDLQSILALVRQHVSNEVDVANSVGFTPLYLATAASTAGSPEERRAKVQQLQKHGASFFFKNVRLFRAIQNAVPTKVMIVHPAVRRLLGLWLIECSDRARGSVSDFCMHWLACVQRPESNGLHVEAEWTLLSQAVNAFVCAGYALDAMPLLLVLPIKRVLMPRFFELLKKLALDSKHASMLQLHAELVIAWQESHRK
ncbi:hypothetical protein CCR75_007562 [Bremia lactucae]|uniref:Uncharacterized protein n=1 Tax=Bremia lactucae TaxID=4779 RepID=A0A976IL19_BRELC|nr:hypothetical protein CCR75_007562 [Bremia lactucae]